MRGPGEKQNQTSTDTRCCLGNVVSKFKPMRPGLGVALDDEARVGFFFASKRDTVSHGTREETSRGALESEAWEVG